jgi:transcriptional regulator with XRE-family HTH domain
MSEVYEPSDVSGRPNEAHEVLGWQLRRLREQRGIMPVAAGRAIGCSASKISRIERGRCTVRENDLYRLLNLYEPVDLGQRRAFLEFARRFVDPQWWDDFRDVVDGWLRSYLILESLTEYIRTYEAMFIPGLLQTPAYAEAVGRLHYHSDTEVMRRVELRMQRRRTVLTGKTVRLWAVINYAALTQTTLPDGFVSPDVMREQINFLIKIAEQPTVVIQILPAGADARTGTGSSFSLLRMGLTGLPDVAYHEHIGGALFLDRRDIAGKYDEAMARLNVAACEPVQAEELLTKAIAELGK